MEKRVKKIERTASAYDYPLIVKQLLYTPMLYAPDQEIVYRDKVRYTYLDLYKRINCLASALTALGVGPGDTVAVSGLGFAPVPGMFFRNSHDGCYPSYG